MERFRLSHNALWRRSDRLETLALIAAVLLSLAALPLAVLVGVELRDDLVVLGERQAETRVRVLGTVLDTPSTLTRAQADGPVTARVSWMTAEGEEHVHTTAVPADAQPGDEVFVWTTSDGRPAPAPLTPDQISADAAVVALGTQAGAMALVWAALVSVRRMLDRHRMRAWDAEWLRISEQLAGNVPRDV